MAQHLDLERILELFSSEIEKCTAVDLGVFEHGAYRLEPQLMLDPVTDVGNAPFQHGFRGDGAGCSIVARREWRCVVARCWCSGGLGDWRNSNRLRDHDGLDDHRRWWCC